MSLTQLARQLLVQDIFNGLTPLQLTEIVRRADRIVYRPGESLIRAGTEGDAAIVVIAGEAVRVDEEQGEGPSRELAGTTGDAVEPGSLLGELAMLVEHVHSTTVIATGSVKAIRITRSALREQMLEDPDLAEHFVARLTARLEGIAKQLRSIDERLQRATEPLANAPFAAA